MNSLKSGFLGMSSWVQLLFLCIFIVFGLFIGSFAIAFVAILFSAGEGNLDLTNLTTEALKSANFMRVAQFIQQVFLFLVPALLCAYLFNKRPAHYLKIDKIPNLKFTAISIFLIIAVQPIIAFTAYYNEQMQLPESMSGIETAMREMEESARAMMEQMLAGDSITILLVNLFIIAVMAGIVEEFLFRGALQQIINKITSNYHIAVWVSAFIFSAIHFQFYGFVPRFILGALLGYMFVWSGNLWVPVIVHFTNNAMSVLLMKAYENKPEYEDIEHLGVGDSWWLTLVSTVLCLAIMFYMRQEYIQRKIKKEVSTF